MPRSSCDFCCNPVELSRSNDSFKAAVLQALCNMAAQLGGVPASSSNIVIVPAATPNITGGAAATVYTLPSTVHRAEVWLTPEAPARLFGKWNAPGASASNWDFYLDPGDTIGYTWLPISSVSLFCASSLTYWTHFNVLGV